MYFILKTKYTLSLEFVLEQIHGNNHWRTKSTTNLELSRTLLCLTTILECIYNEMYFFLLPSWAELETICVHIAWPGVIPYSCLI